MYLRGVPSRYGDVLVLDVGIRLVYCRIQHVAPTKTGSPSPQHISRAQMIPKFRPLLVRETTDFSS